MSERSVNIRGHIPVLDGIRGVAIILVIIFHTTIFDPDISIDRWYHMLARSAWIGVDLFFVLSGFLITGILSDARGGRGYFSSFYIRRVLRIFPLYYLVVAFCVFVLPNLSFSERTGIPNAANSQMWFWLYLSNYYFSERGLDHAILGPTWSLAIEEQFYIVWPLLVWLFPRKLMLKICAALVIGVFFLRFAMLDGGHDPKAIYVLTQTRIDGLAVGSWIALAARGFKGLGALVPVARFLAVALSPFALYLWFAGDLEKSDPLMVRYGYSCVALLFGALLVLTVSSEKRSFLNTVFENPVLRFFGKYSYAIYLFNWPVALLVSMNLFHPDDPSKILGSRLMGQFLFSACATALTVIAALISWHLYEKQFLKLKRWFPTPSSPSNQVLDFGKTPLPQASGGGN